MKTLARRLIGPLCVLAFLLAYGAIPKGVETHAITTSLVGPRTAVFDTARDACELIDIPDTAARAFRDYRGNVHLFATHYVARAAVGPSLEDLRHDCHVVYRSADDPNPAHYNDQTWLSSFYSVDGRKIVALGHMEYHGRAQFGTCSSKDDNACWYNAVTFHLSEDGGYAFDPGQRAIYSMGPPYKYEVNRGPEGYSNATNIIKVGDWYYTMISAWPWPGDCSEDRGPDTCLLRFGESPARTSDILDPSSWRGWNGGSFSISFANPYLDSESRAQDHVLTPVAHMYYASGIYLYQPHEVFVATLWDGWNTAYGVPGLYLSTSSDLVHWSEPSLVIAQAQLRAAEPEGHWSYDYFSLIDPKSTNPNFSTVTDDPYLYYVRMNDDRAPYERVLFRQKIKLSWK